MEPTNLNAHTHSKTNDSTLFDVLVRHSCGILLWGSLEALSGGTPLWETLVGHVSGTLLSDTLVKSPKSAFRMRPTRKVKQEVSSEQAHQAPSPSNFATPALQTCRRHANETATFTSTKLTTPCACHEKCYPARIEPHHTFGNDFDTFGTHTQTSESRA